MISILKFIKPKLKGYSFIYIIKYQIEEFLIIITSFIPTFLGVLIRNCLFKILLGKLKGFIWVASGVHVLHPSRIKVGSNVGINSNSYLNGVGYIELGDYVLIGNNVTIVSGEHPITGRCPSIYERPCIPKKISIERDVWIGAGAVILPGVTVREGSVIGANSVVNRDTRPYSINVGAPIKEIGVR